MFACPIDEMFGDGTGERTVTPEVAYVRDVAGGRLREIVPAPDRVDGTVLVGFDRDTIRVSAWTLRPLSRDEHTEISYIGLDMYGFDVYVLCDVDLGDDGCCDCPHTDD